MFLVGEWEISTCKRRIKSISIFFIQIITLLGYLCICLYDFNLLTNSGQILILSQNLKHEIDVAPPEIVLHYLFEFRFYKKRGPTIVWRKKFTVQYFKTLRNKRVTPLGNVAPFFKGIFVIKRYVMFFCCNIKPTYPLWSLYCFYNR